MLVHFCCVLYGSSLCSCEGSSRMPLYARCCSVLAVPSLLAQAHETNSWWQTHHTPFPQLCQHKCRGGCSETVVKELTQLKISWQKPNHHLCLPVSPGWASTPSQREAVQTLHWPSEGMDSQWHRARMRRERGHYCKSVFTSKSEIFASVKLLP